MTGLPLLRGLLVISLAGCASAPPVGQKDWLAFIAPGVTTRQIVVERLGAPDASYEGGRITTYWVAADEGGYHKPRQAWPAAQFSLVLVFDKDDVLDRHSLVTVRGD